MDRKKVSELAKQVRGVSYKPEDLHVNLDENSVILLRANNINDGKINFHDVVYVDKSKVSKEQYLRKGDILICASSGSKQLVGKAASIVSDMECTFGAFCKVVRPNSDIADYLGIYFQSNNYRNKISEVAIGANINNIRNEHIDSLSLSVGTDKENAEIVRIMASIQRVIDRRKQELQKLDELIKARFVEMFGNDDYPAVKLGSVCKKITDGTHKTPTYLGEGITFISAKNIVNGELDLTDIKHISEEEYQEIQKRCQTAVGDILLSKSGSLGSPIIVKTEEKLGLFESLAVLKYDREKVLPEFLCEQLKTDRIQRQFTTGTKGVAIKHLHLGVIADTNVIVPPLNEQKAFADFVKQIDKSKVAVQKALDEAQLLFDSLMQQYFG